MKGTRALLVVVAVLALVTVPASAVDVAATTGDIGPAGYDARQPAVADHDDNATRTDDPSTEGTIGYVEGYWYDDELDVDDREDAALEDDDLEAVVYRSMARVEVVRELPFREEVPVDVISREEFQAENAELFTDFEEGEELFQNVRYEALFIVDRETDAVAEQEALYGGSVLGYYDPETGEIVIVAEDTDAPEMDEVILGHELLHALQDQHFDLEDYDAGTLDGRSAELGLIEGDAVHVEREYESRCGSEWDCVIPGSETGSPGEFNWGMYLTFFQPYSDGPEYVSTLLEDGGWEAVNDAYDDPPASSSEVIRPGEEREPVEVTHEDRSSDRWERVELEDGPDHASFGEVGMAAMLAAPAFEDRDDEAAVIDEEEVIDGFGSYDYDHEYTDGWAGDELVVYASDDDAIEETGYVWHTEWTDEAQAEEFLEGYLELLEVHGAEPVDDHRDTAVIDEAFPGAYYVEHDGERVTIVRAPSVEELPEVYEGAAPEGRDTLAPPFAADDFLTGFGVPAAVLAIVLVGVTVYRRGR